MIAELGTLALFPLRRRSAILCRVQTHVRRGIEKGKGVSDAGSYESTNLRRPPSVRGLPRQIIRNGRAASRLLDAKTPEIEAARRRDAIARWRRAMADGLTAEQAAKAVGVARSNLYRWEREATPKSRRPRRAWAKPELRRAVERLRQDFPMWGRAKLGPLVRGEGFAVCSDATVGRIIASLVARGLVEPVPTLRRRPYARRWTAKRRFARRLPRDLAAREFRLAHPARHRLRQPDETKAIKHFTAYDPIAKWTVGKAFNRATAQAAGAFLDKVLADMPFRSKPSRSTAEAVQGRARGRLPGQRRRPLRPAAENPANERRSRTIQRRLAQRMARCTAGRGTTYSACWRTCCQQVTEFQNCVTA